MTRPRPDSESNLLTIQKQFQTAAVCFKITAYLIAMSSPDRSENIAQLGLVNSRRGRSFFEAAESGYTKLRSEALERVTTVAEIAIVLKIIDLAIEPFKEAAKQAQAKAEEVTRQAIEAEERILMAQP